MVCLAPSPLQYTSNEVANINGKGWQDFDHLNQNINTDFIPMVAQIEIIFSIARKQINKGL